MSRSTSDISDMLRSAAWLADRASLSPMKGLEQAAQTLALIVIADRLLWLTERLERRDYAEEMRATREENQKNPYRAWDAHGMEGL